MTSAAKGAHTAKQFSPDIIPSVAEEDKRFQAWLHRVRTARLVNLEPYDPTGSLARLPTDPAWPMTEREKNG